MHLDFLKPSSLLNWKDKRKRCATYRQQSVCVVYPAAVAWAYRTWSVRDEKKASKPVTPYSKRACQQPV